MPVNEPQARAAAGLTMVLGAVAFAVALLHQIYWPLQAVSVLFSVDFLARLTVGLPHSPVGAVGAVLTRRSAPDWVSARPKRFAWTLGLAMSAAMAVITNSGIRGWPPRTICLICLVLMWSEAVLGLCVGCELHGLLVRRGWMRADPDADCATNGCRIRPDDHRQADPQAPAHAAHRAAGLHSDAMHGPGHSDAISTALVATPWSVRSAAARPGHPSAGSAWRGRDGT